MRRIDLAISDPSIFKIVVFGAYLEILGMISEEIIRETHAHIHTYTCTHAHMMSGFDETAMVR